MAVEIAKSTTSTTKDVVGCKVKLSQVEVEVPQEEEETEENTADGDGETQEDNQVDENTPVVTEKVWQLTSSEAVDYYTQTSAYEQLDDTS